MIILSINQRITPSFKELFLDGDDFKVLDNEQRRILMKYIDVNDSEISSADGFTEQNQSLRNESTGQNTSMDLAGLIDNSYKKNRGSI